MSNSNLKTFEGELKELLKKYNVALDIKAEIVAVDLTKAPTPSKAQVALAP